MDLRSFTPTLCAWLDVPPPAFASQAPIAGLTSRDGVFRRALVYCPDAFGQHVVDRFTSLHERLRRASTHEVEVASMLPPKTPVCFASLFTGGTPEQHGIRRYERPVLTCDTVFDALVRAGKKVAIVAVEGSSIDVIFRERQVDYFSMQYDPLVTAKTLALVAADEHDVVVAYHQEYDDLLHATGPFSALAIRALEHYVETWETLTQAAREAWHERYAVAFCPDHGGHDVPETGGGDHGEDRPEDMRVRHFFALG